MLKAMTQHVNNRHIPGSWLRACPEPSRKAPLSEIILVGRAAQGPDRRLIKKNASHGPGRTHEKPVNENSPPPNIQVHTRTATNEQVSPNENALDRSARAAFRLRLSLSGRASRLAGAVPDAHMLTNRLMVGAGLVVAVVELGLQVVGLEPNVHLHRIDRGWEAAVGLPNVGT